MKRTWFSHKRRVRRDYSRKAFSNPLFDAGKVQGGFRWRRWLTLAAAVAAFAGWIWFVAFSPSFQVNDIQVVGAQKIPEWEIRDVVREVLKKRRWLVLPQSSILIVPESDVAAALEERYVLESLTVTKLPPHVLRVELKERVSAIVLQMPDGRQGLIGLDGEVTKLYGPEQALDVVKKFGPSLDADTGKPQPSYHVLYDDRDEELDLREKALAPEIVQAVIDLPQRFAAEFGNAPYLDVIRIDGKDAASLKAVTSEGWSVYLSVSEDLGEQLDNASVILKDKVGNDRRSLDYIDVRFGDKIFFKLRS